MRGKLGARPAPRNQPDRGVGFAPRLSPQGTFPFFNGNTFAAIARQLAEALFRSLPVVRRREVISAFAHYVAGVLDRDSMVNAVESLYAVAALAPGNRVQTLRGTTRGTIVRILDDGRVVWKPEGTNTKLTGLPESLRLIE